MARSPKYRLTLYVTAANINSVESRIQKHFPDTMAKHCLVKVDLPNSRSERLAAAQKKVEDAKSEVEELRGELEEWYDKLPDSFQNGEQGEGMQEAIDALQELENELESLNFGNINFPGMRA